MKTEPVFLRALEMADLDRTLRWHNDPVLYETLGGAFRPVSRAVEREWLRRKRAPTAQEINLAVCAAKGRRHVGNIYLRNLDWVARYGELHLFIGDRSDRGKGYGRSAVRQMADLAFRTLGLRRLYLRVLADNAAAIKTYEKCGFVVEGRLRRHAFKGGRFKDMLVMGLCAPPERQGDGRRTAGRHAGPPIRHPLANAARGTRSGGPACRGPKCEEGESR